MKKNKNRLGFGIVILFFIMLIFPKTVFSGASDGLLLWFQILLPTLFPFLLVTNLLLATGTIHYIASAFGGMCSRIFRVSPNGSFAVLTGFLCGYPMGAKMTADLTTAGYITPQEGRYLLSFCNNTSPVFILNFIVWKTLNDESFTLPTLLILMLSPVIVSFFTRKKYLSVQNQTFAAADPPLYHPNQKIHPAGFQKLDEAIMDSFETLIKVGGYIILFSVILAVFQNFPTVLPGIRYLLPFLEMTNGILFFAKSELPLFIQYPLIVGLSAFGGICSVAQTQCMIQKAGFSIRPYIKEKLAAALTASTLSLIYLFLFR